MITDVLLKSLQKDPFIKRNLTKTISWAIIGSLDTFLVAWLVTQVSVVSAKIALADFLTKLIIYYFYERFWQNSKFGFLSRPLQSRLVQKEIKPNLYKHAGKVTRQDRERLNYRPSFTLWLTGLSGAGKSTLAVEIEEWIYKNQGHAYILDGDNTRLGINSDLSFSDEDRAENIRRVAEICRLFNEAGVIVIASFISPFITDRSRAKAIIGKENFIEVFIDASVTVCRERDTKGLYKMALEGKIRYFTGISSPYEPPVNPDIHLNTELSSIEDCLIIIKQSLSERMNKQPTFNSDRVEQLV